MKIKRDKKGRFLKGSTSLNKGKTLEDWVGEEKASEIRAKMSEHSKKKGEFLKSLNKNKEYLKKRKESRWKHEMKVKEIRDQYREEEKRVFALSQYEKDERQPDLILFQDGKLIAIEIESKKKYKPSEKTMIERFKKAHLKNSFFDDIIVIFFEEKE